MQPDLEGLLSPRYEKPGYVGVQHQRRKTHVVALGRGATLVDKFAPRTIKKSTVPAMKFRNKNSAVSNTVEPQKSSNILSSPQVEREVPASARLTSGPLQKQLSLSDSKSERDIARRGSISLKPEACHQNVRVVARVRPLNKLENVNLIQVLNRL